ncbi:hypothetical protein [Streptococcus merionis]|uniref:Uncharacterized protein n=1 Tax=Streptococcus merionis TaxID=400065 RepID=A0A239SVG2_9STRE|nr:hypothetical protein [Streptococcus merionis]SNU89460.1 Uncharacterised protein [Streptococcus merionis]
MTKKKSDVLFGLGLLAAAISLAYLRLTSEQKKKIGQAKDDFLGTVDSQANDAGEHLKDVTDSLVQETDHMAKSVSDEAGVVKEKAQTSMDDILGLVEDKVSELRKYLKQ